MCLVSPLLKLNYRQCNGVKLILSPGSRTVTILRLERLRSPDTTSYPNLSNLVLIFVIFFIVVVVVIVFVFIFVVVVVIVVIVVDILGLDQHAVLRSRPRLVG